MAAKTSKETIAGMDEEKKMNSSAQEKCPAEDFADAGSAEQRASSEDTKNAEETTDQAEEDVRKDDPEDKNPKADEEEVVDGVFTQKEESAKKGFFKRKKDKKDEKIEELTDRVKRQMAEFENFRKRTEKEKSLTYDMGAKSVIEKILPVIDNFERGLAQAADHDDPFVEGMDKIYKSMLQELESIGVKPIEAEGKEFDPNLHNAVMHCEDENVGENIVVQELQKGYTYHGSVVRHSMVKVAN